LLTTEREREVLNNNDITIAEYRIVNYHVVAVRKKRIMMKGQEKKLIRYTPQLWVLTVPDDGSGVGEAGSGGGEDNGAGVGEDDGGKEPSSGS